MGFLFPYINRLRNPIYLVILVILVGFLASQFSGLGMDGITYAVLGAAAIVVLIPLVGSAIKTGWHAMIHGESGVLDFAVSPGGYRRARQAETEEEQVAQSIVQPTPNRPFIIDALPSVASSSSVQVSPTAVVKGSSMTVAPYRGGLLETKLNLSADCKPPINFVLGRAILGVGQRGSGKTNLAARLIEQIGQFPIPMAIFDYEEDYLTLPALSKVKPNVLNRCVIAGRPDWEEAFRYREYYWQVDTENAREVGYEILEQGVQLVLEVGTYLTLEEGARIMTEIIRGMFDWANEQDPKKRVPNLVLLDEAQHFLPQNSGVSNIREEEAGELLKAFMDINARGRKRGFTPAIFTQRIAQIRKEVIAGSEIYFLMRQTISNDLQVYEGLLGKDDNNKQRLDRRTVQAFEKGDGIVFEGGEMFITHFDERESEHRGNTPKLEQALNRYGDRPLAQRSRNKSPLVPDEEIEDEDEQELECMQLGKDVFITMDQFALAVKLRKEGLSKGYRDLMPVFELSEHHAKELNKRIREVLGQEPEQEGNGV